jgi:hypothetical protein
VTGHLEAGSVTVTQADGNAWHSVGFGQTISNARVVMGPLSFGDASPAMIRVRNVTDQGFEFQIDEWDYLDGRHATETIGWVAGTAGSHSLASGQTVSFGRATATDSDAAAVALTGYGAAPAVFAQVSSYNRNQAVTTRLHSVSSNRYAVHRQEEERNDGIHLTESVDWMAIDYGTAGVTDVAAARGVTDAWTTLGFDALTDEFAFIAAMQTESGSDTAVLRYDSLTSGSARILIEEETSRDGETTHTTEQVAFLTLGTGHYDLYA